jgi:hypothetical protein
MKIELEFDEETFRNLRRTMQVRRIATGLGGLTDAFLVRLIEKLEEGETFWRVEQKKDVD